MSASIHTSQRVLLGGAGTGLCERHPSEQESFLRLMVRWPQAVGDFWGAAGPEMTLRRPAAQPGTSGFLRDR